MDSGTLATIADALVPVLAIAFGFLFTQLRSLVKATENKVDDAIYEAARAGLRDAIVDAEPERKVEEKQAEKATES